MLASVPTAFVRPGLEAGLRRRDLAEATLFNSPKTSKQSDKSKRYEHFPRNPNQAPRGARAQHCEQSQQEELKKKIIPGGGDRAQDLELRK